MKWVARLLMPWVSVWMVASMGLLSPAFSVSPAATSPDGVPYLFYRKKQHLNHLYTVDTTAQKQRQAVFIVPGRAQERQSNPWWGKLIKALNKDPQLQERYKFYLFLYDSTEDLPVLSWEFANDLTFFTSHQANRKPVVILSYSLGGLVVRDALLSEPQLLKEVQTIFGMAVPYHGSPLFDPEWFEVYMRHFSPIRQQLDKLTYRVYLSSKSNLVRDMGWRNFDNSLPVFTPSRRIKQGGAIAGTTKPAFSSPLAQNLERIKTFQNKLIVYASYLPNPYIQENKPNYLATASKEVLALPKEIIGSVIPFYGLTVHAVMQYMNRQLANLPIYSPEAQQPQFNHLYKYNDGVIPLSSMLYLPNRATPYTEDLNGLAQAYQGCALRVFKQADHVDLGHYRWPEFLLKTNDALNPRPQEIKPLQWLFNDLKALKEQPTMTNKEAKAHCGLATTLTVKPAN
jgi:hypothetical protein